MLSHYLFVIGCLEMGPWIICRCFLLHSGPTPQFCPCHMMCVSFSICRRVDYRGTSHYRWGLMTLAVIQEKNRKEKVDALKNVYKILQHLCPVSGQCVKYNGRISKLWGKGRHMGEHAQAVTLEMCTHKINVCRFTKVAGQIWKSDFCESCCTSYSHTRISTYHSSL